MKYPFYKSLVAAGAVAIAGSIVACGDDSGSSVTSAQSQIVSNPCAGITLTADAWLLGSGEDALLIFADGRVTNVAGAQVYTFDGANIVDATGTPILAVDVATLVQCPANATVDPSGNVVLNSSSSTETTDPAAAVSSATAGEVTSTDSQGSDAGLTPASGTSTTDPTSSATTDAGTVTAESSAATSNISAGSEFPSIESYGAPSAEYTKDILENGQTGWSSRYWDACKPHCSWLSSIDTTSEETYKAGMTVARNCNIHDVEVPAFTLSHAVQQYWMGFEGTNSACDTKDSTGTFTCTDMAPIAVNDTLAYGYVAGSGSLYQYGCGKCYHLQFNGGNHANDVKATHKALKGKHLVVMVSNIGYDVEAGQFDMLVPGGGVGAFDALSTMLGVSKDQLGAGSGGFLTECQQSGLGYDNTVAAYQECVIAKCESVFANMPNLLRGCKWYAEWYMAADNPTYNWEEVECPQYLVDHYMTTINTTKDNRYRWHDDWSSYKQGDVLETQDCLTDEYPQGCAP